MTMSQLDFYFPFIVFFYGLLVLFMMDFPAFQEIRRKLVVYGTRSGWPAFFENKPSKAFLYFMTLFSGLWAAQNLYFS